MLKRSLWLLPLIISLFSCDPLRLKEQNENLAGRTWHKDSVLTFMFRVDDIHKSYNFYMNIRNTLNYPFQNIYVNYSLEDTLGNIYEKDLINLQLFDRITGKPLGSGLGDIFDHQELFLETYSFNNPGVYMLKMEQYMRRDELPEVVSAGMRIEFNE